MVRAVLSVAVIACCLAAGPARHDRALLRVGGTPYALLSGQGSLWVLTCDRGCTGEARQAVGRIVRIDPHSARVVGSRPIPRPHAIAVGSRAVYAVDFWRDRIHLIAPRTLQVVRSLRLRLPFRFSARDNAFLPFAAAVGANAVWIATDRGALARADLRLKRVVATVRLPFDAFGGMAAGPHALWLGESLAGVYRVDPRTNRVASRIRVALPRARFDATEVIPCGGQILVVGARVSAGVLTARNDLARIDVRRNRGEVMAPLPSGPLALTCGAGSLWLARPEKSLAERIDPHDGAVLERRSGRVGTAIAFAAGHLWTALPDGTVRQLGK